jgi:hypothetical protein
MPPNRWLHVRHPEGFDPRQFEMFRAHCRLFRACVECALTDWRLIQEGEPPRYEFFEPELSADRTTATLPIGGEQTLGSRHAFEDGRSYMLWEWFPISFIEKLEEGVTEMVTGRQATSWRKPSLRIPAWARPPR